MNEFANKDYAEDWGSPPPAPRSIADTLDELKKLYPDTLAAAVDELDKLCGSEENVRVHATGAKRSKDADDCRFDLVNPTGLARLAKRYKLGAERYGDNNWLRGFPIGDLLNHSIRHIFLYLSGDRSDDHMAGAAWGLFAAMHSEERWPHLNAGLLGPGCTLPESPILEVEL